MTDGGSSGNDASRPADPPSRTDRGIYASRELKVASYVEEDGPSGAPVDLAGQPSAARASFVFIAVLVAAAAGVLFAYRSYKARRPDAVARTVTIGGPAAVASNRTAARFDGDAAAVRRMVEAARRTALAHSEAELLAAGGLADRAVAKLEAHLEAFPDSVDTRRRLAQYRIALREFDAAGPYVADVLRADPRDAQARLMLAEVLMGTGQHDGALEAAQWVLELLPRDAAALRMAGLAALRAGRPQAAVVHLFELREVRRSDPECVHLIALCHLRMGEFAKAVSHLSNLVREETADEAVYFNLAACHAQQLQARDAAEVMSRAASRFGNVKVRAWIPAEEFAPIRKDPLFSAFVEQLGPGAGPAVAPARPGPGLGMLPATAVPGRPADRAVERRGTP